MFDNFKALLIFIVVLGHMFLKISEGNGYIRLSIAYIYTFHMPAFIFISGYFSKNLEKCRRNTLVTLLPIYVIFSIIYSLVYNQSIVGAIVNPPGIMWYLFCIIIWKLSLEHISKVRFVLLVSIVLALYVGVNPEIGKLFSFSRLVCFLPFFLLGYYFDQSVIDRIKKIPYWIAVCIFIVVSFVTVLAYNYGFIDMMMPYMVSSYDQMHYSSIWLGLISRFFVFFVAFIIILCLIRIIPNKKLFFTSFGSNTLSIYLLHPLIIEVLANTIIFKSDNILLCVVLQILLSIVLVFVLGQNIVSKVIKEISTEIGRVCFLDDESN